MDKSLLALLLANVIRCLFPTLSWHSKHRDRVAYTASDQDTLRTITAAAADKQTAPCWVVLTTDGRLAYKSNTGSGTPGIVSDFWGSSCFFASSNIEIVPRRETGSQLLLSQLAPSRSPRSMEALAKDRLGAPHR